MENEITDIDKIPIVESKQFDAKRYRGKSATIASVNVIEVIDYYTGPLDESGRPTYKKNSTDKKKVVQIETEKLPELDATGKVIGLSEITVNTRFNLKKEVKDGKTEWVISKAPKADLWAFMRKLEATKLSELIDKNVILDIEADKEDPSRFWLRISK